MAYHSFASYYDRLTWDVDYPGRAAYFHALFERFQTRKVELLLDLACGTGSLSMELAKLGYDVIAVDGSEDMLSEAMEKNDGAYPILFLCQQMEELDLYGTIDGAVCALDSLNHVTDPEKVRRILDKVSLFMNPGGIFIFDVNTVYKHREVLSESTFVYEDDDLYCVWQNGPMDEDHCVEIALDFFSFNGESYDRESECFKERAYPPEELEGWLQKAGMEVLGIFGDDTLEPPKADAQRLIFVTRKSE
ncbi:class I SAM-dependent DNA methyltransferase [Zongyangia hominis]|uniref:Class I SAM-dependent methyltransferase n=1 Tax=Zongyangia hominis TaxID=2763677 RepID=A0A926EAN5_9FIRM|nr:class I SAM-dependent methyltransferase [Zongyangia hominis]MBC8569558.1 class I SAM-dependent methyltransferase [Zongyangia hominis]